MTLYGKMSQTAIAAASALAEQYDQDSQARLNSAEIAERRSLPQPVVAKVLTLMSQAGIVSGSPGPGGGYSLSRPPARITLFDIVSLFERVEKNDSCPLGPDYCGTGPQCPYHDEIIAMREQLAEFLRDNTLAAFVQQKKKAAKAKGKSVRKAK